MAEYLSSFTGAEIDAAITKVRALTDADTINDVIAEAVDMVDKIVAVHIATTVGEWSYIKLASGVCALWGQQTVDLGSVNKNTYMTTGFYTDSIEVPLPFNPGEAENTVVLGMAQNLCSVVNAFTGLSSGNPVMGFRLKREVNMSQVTPVRFLIIGRWK